MYRLLKRHYFKKYHGNYRHARKLFLFDIFLLLSALLMFLASIFFFLWKPGIADKIDLNLSLGNQKIISGENVVLEVGYINKAEIALNNAVLAVHLPDGFIINKNLTPETLLNENSVINIGYVEPGAKNEYDIHGVLWSDFIKDERIDAILSYQADGFDYREQKLSSMHLQLADSILNLEAEIPEKVFPNTNIPIQIRLANTSNEKIDRIILEQNWELNQEVNPLNEEVFLQEKQEKNINLKLKSPSEAGTYTWVLKAGVLIDNKIINQKTITKDVEIFYPQVKNKLITTNNSYLSAGDNFNAIFSWENSSAYTLDEIEGRIKFEPIGVVDVARTAKANGLISEGNELIITKNNRTAMSYVAPGTKDELNLNIYTLPAFTLKDINPNLKITPALNIKMQNVQEELKQAGEIVSIPLSTELYLNAQVRYYTDEGDQLGIGPLPPQVGEATKYWVFIKIYNTTSEIKDINFNCQLANSVAFSKKQSVSIGNPLKYEQNANSLNWDYKSLPPFSQTGLYFEVEITPSPEDIGKNINIIKNSTITASDTITEKTFDLNTGPQNNSLPTTDRGSGKNNKVNN